LNEIVVKIGWAKFNYETRNHWFHDEQRLFFSFWYLLARYSHLPSATLFRQTWLIFHCIVIRVVDPLTSMNFRTLKQICTLKKSAVWRNMTWLSLAAANADPPLSSDRPVVILGSPL
jgi:hypothetical protein